MNWLWVKDKNEALSNGLNPTSERYANSGMEADSDDDVSSLMIKWCENALTGHKPSPFSVSMQLKPCTPVVLVQGS